MSHDGGAVFVFKNDSKSDTLEEEITFDLKNLRIDGQEDQKSVKISLAPGIQKEIFLYIKINDVFSVKTKSVFNVKTKSEKKIK
jgi:hypothetical protein